MIIGLTGTLASGKGVVSNFLKEIGFVYLSLSDELREIAKEMKIELTRKNLQDLGNHLREGYGAAFLAERVASKIKNQEYKKAIIDGIRNPAEVNSLRQIKNFFLISVDAPQEIRFQRLAERNRESDPKTWEEFLKVDNRDNGFGELETGQNVAKCMQQGDFKLINSGTLEEFKEKVKNLYEEIGREIPRLTWDEYFMEIAKAVAKRATCDRGRSGCVIARDRHILVTGYVGAPAGLPHCDEIGHQMKTLVHGDRTTSQHCVRTAHAEQNAICQAAKLGVSLQDSTLYCKMTPCSTCAKMIINAGIKRIVSEKDYHTSGDTKEMFKQADIKLEILSSEIETYKNM